MRILSPSSDVSDAPTLVTNKDDETEKPSLVPNSTPKVPTVVLDTDVVSDNMAARLCITFLSHILFLKNQVPFPIVQLARMPTSDNTTRAAKKRYELLNSFDTLASHLYTTFIALSTALALRGCPEKVQGMEALCHRRTHGLARAFFAVALGPTVGAARSRVIVGIDGLETKVWGLKDDSKTTSAGDVSEEEEEEEEASDTDDGEWESDDEQGQGSGEEEDASPPPSRSPSPSSDSDTASSTSRDTPPTTEDPETVRAAERLLSRTLANACAEDDGHGLAAEMAPTQIHVLLRAPRRFDHSCWIPRQNLCASLDSYLADFLLESGETPVTCDATSAVKKRGRTNKVQGIWVKSRGSSAQSSEQDLAEEDELIWWSWDGKLAGFADW